MQRGNLWLKRNPVPGPFTVSLEDRTDVGPIKTVVPPLFFEDLYGVVPDSVKTAIAQASSAFLRSETDEDTLYVLMNIDADPLPNRYVSLDTLASNAAISPSVRAMGLVFHGS